MKRKHDSHSILLQAMIMHGVRWVPFGDNRNLKGELCFDGLRYATELDRFGCPIIPNNLLIKLVPLTTAYHEQPLVT